jgi:hypothetical protein
MRYIRLQWACAVTYLWVGWRAAGRKLEQARTEVKARGAERDAWRTRPEKLLRGLGEEIDRQLRTERLTPVERDSDSLTRARSEESTTVRPA